MLLPLSTRNSCFLSGNKLTFLFLIFCFLVSACQTAKIRKKTADDLAQDLEQGALLVRLHTAENKAAALRQTGKNEEAGQLIAQRQAFNDSVRSAFASQYDFSPVYFFYAKDSRLVREKKFEEILHDAQEKVVAVDQIADRPLLAAEFGEVQAPASQAGLDALLVLDDQLRQLSAPFPFSVPTHLYSRNVLHQKAVASLNLKLKTYYGKALRREQKRKLKRMRKEMLE